MVTKLYLIGAKASKVLAYAIEIIIAILIATCAVDIIYQVAYRFIIVKFFTISSPFTEEYARYAMIWSAYLGIGLCFREANMPALNLLYDALKGKYRYMLYAVVRILIAIFLFIGIRWGYAAMMNMSNYRSPVLALPGRFLYSAPMVACILMAFEWVIDVLGVVTKQIEPFEGRKPVSASSQIVEAV